MFGLARPASHFNRSTKDVKLHIVRFSCFCGIVVVSSILFMNSPESSSKDEILLPSNNKLQAIHKVNNKNLMKSRVINIEGNHDLYSNANIDQIANKNTVTELDLHYVQLDPRSFTESLKEFVNLKTIKLDSVKMMNASWNFQPVSLEHIEEFYIDITLGFHDQYTDYIGDFTDEHLSNLVFFEKNFPNKTPSTDLATKLALSGVKVTIRVDGWSVLCLQESKSEANSYEAIIAVQSTDKILKTLKQHLKIIHLTMTECTVSKPAFPISLKYLNLYRVNITEGTITEALQSMTNLTDLYLELRNGTMKMSEVPKSVKTLAISDINAVYGTEDTSSAEMVALGFPMDPDIIVNFEKIFTNVRQVAIFEPTNGTQYQLLQSVLKSKVEWIYFEGFERTENASKTALEEEIETFLETLRVSPEERHALIVRENTTLMWKQEELTKEQQLHYRYKMLGWDEYITWETYVDNFLPK